MDLRGVLCELPSIIRQADPHRVSDATFCSTFITDFGGKSSDSGNMLTGILTRIFYEIR
jgi:hypothetical protein